MKARAGQFVSLLAAALTLTACGQAEPPDVSIPSAPIPDAATTPAAVEGPASEAHTWPDGLTVKLAKVEQVPRSWGVDVPADRALVRVTITVTNGGATPIPNEPQSKETALLYGPNRQEADTVTGYSYDTAAERHKVLDSDTPTRFAPNTPVTITEAGLVPTAELGELAVTVSLPAETGIRDPWTFTGAEKLLEVVK